jgi:hypothetical protein
LPSSPESSVLAGLAPNLDSPIAVELNEKFIAASADASGAVVVFGVDGGVLLPLPLPKGFVLLLHCSPGATGRLGQCHWSDFGGFVACRRTSEQGNFRLFRRTPLGQH